MSVSNRKIFWGLLAILPWALLLFVVVAFALDWMPDGESPTFLGRNWFYASGIAITVIWGAFIYHAKRNPSIPDVKRQLWVWLIVLGNFYVLPVYWWHYINNDA